MPGCRVCLCKEADERRSVEIKHLCPRELAVFQRQFPVDTKRGIFVADDLRPVELIANFAGGVVVMKMGTAVVTPEELRAAVEADRALLS